MHFYERANHVAAKVSTLLTDKCKWWMPCVATSIVASLFLLGGPEWFGQLLTLGNVVVLPYLSPVPFQLPAGMPEPAEDEDEGSCE